MFIRTLAALMLVALVPVTALAGKPLVTGLAFSDADHYLVCSIVNADPVKTAKITTVELRGIDGTAALPIVNFCGATLAPMDTCYAFFNDTLDGYCVFDVKGKVRANLLVMSGQVVITAIPATVK